MWKFFRSFSHAAACMPRVRRQRTKPILAMECLETREVLSAATLWDIGTGNYDLAQTFQLHSNASALHTIYLDFDGYTTGNVQGTSWDNLTSPAWDYSGNGASFTDAERKIIQKIWARVSEDYAPFNVDVTTQDPGAEALRKSGTTDDRWGIRVVITPDDKPARGAGGVAYIGSFNYSNLTPAYVFNVGEKGVAEAISHEVGHTLGLGHDGTSRLAYYYGQGSGATSWGPIMGAAYDPIVTQFSKGEYAGANNKQDDLNLITTQNGFSYISDDYGNSQTSAFPLLSLGESQISATFGIIERNTDADWFSFWSDPGTISFNINPAPLGPNLAVRADLYNASGALLATINPAGALDADFDFTLLGPGQYFLKLTGTGKGNPLTDGFSNYASLGNYRITGSVQAFSGPGTENLAPIANPDVATTTNVVPVTLDLLANDYDPNGDVVTLLDVSEVEHGTAVLSGNTVIFTPTPGFVGIGSFNYTISDGNGETASSSATITVNPGFVAKTFTNDTNVAISTTRTSTITSTQVLSGLSGTIQDVDVTVNINHTYVSDLKITLIAPDGTRVVLFNRHGGTGNHLANTTFDSAASNPIASAAAPFTGSFTPFASLNLLNGKTANGTWKLEVQDFDRRDGGFLDNWTLNFRLSPPTAPAPAKASSKGHDALPFVASSTQTFAPTTTTDPVGKQPASSRPQHVNAPRVHAIKHWLASHDVKVEEKAELDFDFPAAGV